MPALAALAIQCAALLAAFPILLLFHAHTGVQPPPVAAALVQGAIAAALSRWRGLAPWWLIIQLLFPGAILAAQALALPPGVHLAAFILLLALYWTTFRTQVPFYPSRAAAWHKVAGLLPQDRPLRFIDIGSGLGGLVLDLARRRPGRTGAGPGAAPAGKQFHRH